MQINPKTLRYILAIAEEKSFSRGASDHRHHPDKGNLYHPASFPGI